MLSCCLNSLNLKICVFGFCNGEIIKMKPKSEATVCLLCFESIEKLIFVPSDGPSKIFGNCITYLHSTLTKETLQDIQLNKQNQLPLCKSCFDSALELTQLSEQLTTVQKDISDLTVSFSMAVFHRRSQVYSLSRMQNNSQSFNNSSIIEFNEACLPPNLFSGKNDYQNIHYNKNSNVTFTNNLQTPTDIRNLDPESSFLQFDNLSNLPIIPESSIVDNAETKIQFNQENRDQQWIQPTIEGDGNLRSISEMRIVHLEGGNHSKNCTNGNSEMQPTMTNLLKSIKMPFIKLERINIESNEMDASVVNSFKKNCEAHPKFLDVAPFKDDEMADPSYVPSNSSRREKLRKRLHCKKTVVRQGEKNIKNGRFGRKRGRHLRCSICEIKFTNRISLEAHERAHTGEMPFNCSLCEKTFRTQKALKHHGIIHGEEKPFQCELCETRFYYSSSLKRHLESHGEKFQCSICKKRYCYLSSLKRHEESHGQKFQCLICKQRYRYLSTLKRHEISCHSETSPLRVKKNKKRRKVHQKFESKKKSPLACSFCKHHCGSLAHLKLHENMHINGVMNFKCSFCQVTFANDKDKIVHEKTHTIASGRNDEGLIVGI